MFFVLRRKDDKQLLSVWYGVAGVCITTPNLQQAKLFRLVLKPDHQVNPAEKVTNGGITCQVEGDGIPAGLPGTWEIVPVDLRLA